LTWLSCQRQRVSLATSKQHEKSNRDRVIGKEKDKEKEEAKGLLL